MARQLLELQQVMDSNLGYLYAAHQWTVKTQYDSHGKLNKNVLSSHFVA